MQKKNIIEKLVRASCEKVCGTKDKKFVAELSHELTASLHRVLLQEELYEYVSTEMQKGLYGIFRDITTVSSEFRGEKHIVRDSQKIFADTSKQLDEIMETVLSATESIMSRTEELLEKQEQSVHLLKRLRNNPKDEELLTSLEELIKGSCCALSSIMTSLAFQDLTGQRLKKVAHSVEKIKEKVFDLYVSTGILLQQKDDLGEKNLEQMKEESQRLMAKMKKSTSELKGPVLNRSQEDVDNLLENLGL